MGAHDRPFPPGGLPPEASRIFRMCYELGYRKEHLVDKRAEEGRGSLTTRRKIGQFEIQVEHEIAVPENLVRWTVMLWYEERLVYHAWCSLVAETREAVGVVVTDEPGEWRAYLRMRAEREEKA